MGRFNCAIISVIIASTWAITRPATSQSSNIDARVTSIVIWTWDASGWQPDAQKLTSYDDSGCLTAEEYQDYEDNDWAPRSRIMYQCNVNGKTTEMIFSLKNEKSWQDEERTIYSFNNDGLLETEIHQDWASDWKNARRTDLRYDDLDRLSETLEATWGTDTWGAARERHSYMYKGQTQQLVQYLSQRLYGFEWSDDQRILFNYDISGRLLSTTEQEYNSYQVQPDPRGGPYWLDAYRTLRAYDVSGASLIETTQRPDLSASGYTTGWIDESREEQYVDAAQNVIETRTYVESMVEGVLLYFSRTFSSYDPQGNLVEDITQLNFGNAWTDYVRTTYEYTGTSVAVATLDEDELLGEVSTYPNPFTSSLTLSFVMEGRDQLTIEIYNVLGQLVGLVEPGQMAAGRHRIGFDGAYLSAGTYYFILRAGESLRAGAITKINQ